MSKLKRPFVVAFSGGCCSGKTTMLNALKEQLEKEGHKVLTFKADSHAYLAERNTTIDAIRRRAFDYLRFQEWICHEQANFENQILQGHYNEYDVILLDRSLFDCIFYTKYYIDLGSPSLEVGNGFERYYDLQLYLDKHANKAVERIYDLILIFDALKEPKGNTETYTRPASLKVLKYIESFGIAQIVTYYTALNHPELLKYINLNTTKQEEAVQDTIKTIKWYSNAYSKSLINTKSY